MNIRLPSRPVSAIMTILSLSIILTKLVNCLQAQSPGHQEGGHDSAAFDNGLGDPDKIGIADDPEFDKLLEVLDHETSIATKTKLNSDFVPGMVTVLYGRDLEALGIRNVWEALSLIPGIQILRNRLSEPSITVRGLEFPFNVGNIKILVNSVAMSREDYGKNSSIPLIPIEQVERIEFIRGSGSSLYGSYAFMGLLNIITRTDNYVFGGIEEDDNYDGGGGFSWTGLQGDLKLNGNIAGFRNNNAFAPVTNGGENSYLSSIFAIGYKQARLRFQMINHDKQLDDGFYEDERDWSVDYHQQLPISETVATDIRLSLVDNDIVLHQVGAGRGEVYSGEVDIRWDGIANHTWLLSLSYAQYYLDEASIVLPPPLPMVHVEDEHWRTAGVSIQDEIRLTSRLNLTIGARYDERTDIDVDNVGPRIGAVWHVRDHHLLKAQYTQGFRPPTFFELYNNGIRDDSIDPALIETIEFGYIHERHDGICRLTIYYSSLTDMIYPALPAPGISAPTGAPAEPAPSTNEAEGILKGIELEWQQQLTERLKVIANVSYADSQNSRGIADRRRESAAGADVIGNLGILFRLSRNVVLTGRWYHVGDRTFPGGDIDGYDTVDITLNAFNFLTDSLTLRAGIANTFDQEPVYIDPIPLIPQVRTYPGRTVWMKLAYEF